MTPIRTAVQADIHHVLQTGLRIREASPSPANSARRSQSIAYAHLLRDAFGHLRAGWRWLERKRTQQLSSRRLRVSETISLGEKRTVSIVQVDDAQYLIGCSTGSVQLLAVLDKRQDAARCSADSERAS